MTYSVNRKLSHRLVRRITNYCDHFQSLGRLRLLIGPGGVICLVQEFLPLGPATHAIPVSTL